MNRTFKPERQKIEIFITLNYLADRDKIFPGGTHYEWAFVGSPWLPQQIQDGGDSHR